MPTQLSSFVLPVVISAFFIVMVALMEWYCSTGPLDQFRLESYPPVAIAPPPPTAGPLDADAMLWAIAQVESGGDHLARGHAGERGAWQFTETTWHELMPGVPWTDAHDPVVADVAANRNYARITDRLRKSGQPRTPQSIYLGWNPHAPAATALHVANLYFDRLSHS